MRLLFDEDFNQRIVRGLLRRIPNLDYRSAHDADLTGQLDNEILAAAITEARLLVSHDVKTMTAHFNARVADGATVPGLLLVPQRLDIGRAISDLELICRATDAEDWLGMIEYLPLSPSHDGLNRNGIEVKARPGNPGRAATSIGKQARERDSGRDGKPFGILVVFVDRGVAGIHFFAFTLASAGRETESDKIITALDDGAGLTAPVYASDAIPSRMAHGARKKSAPPRTPPAHRSGRQSRLSVRERVQYGVHPFHRRFSARTPTLLGLSALWIDEACRTLETAQAIETQPMS